MRKIFVDMDGVVADFIAGMKLEGIDDPDVFKLMPGAYENLPLMPQAKEAICELEKMGEVWFATKIPSKNPGAASEKLRWVEKNFPHMIKRVIITPNKGILGGVDDILIDDRPHKANCLDFRGVFFYFSDSWSQVFQDMYECRII